MATYETEDGGVSAVAAAVAAAEDEREAQAQAQAQEATASSSSSSSAPQPRVGADYGPIHHICGLPNWPRERGANGKFAMYPKRAGTMQQAFINEFLLGGIDLPASCGVHLLTYSSFTVVLTAAEPMFVLGDNPDVLQHVAHSQYYAQPGWRDDEEHELRIPPAQFGPPIVRNVEMGVGANKRTVALEQRVKAGTVGDTKATVVVSWFIEEMYNRTSYDIGINVGQKRKSAWRCEPGVVVATPVGASAATVPSKKKDESKDQRFTMIAYGGLREAKLRCLSQPNTGDIKRLLNTAKAETVRQALAETPQSVPKRPGMVRVDEDSLMGKHVRYCINVGVLRRGDYDPGTQTVGGESSKIIDIEAETLEKIRSAMRMELAELETMSDLRDLGNVFVQAEPVVRNEPGGSGGGAGASSAPSSGWSVRATIGLLFAYTNTIDDLPPATNSWFVSFGEDGA